MSEPNTNGDIPVSGHICKGYRFETPYHTVEVCGLSGVFKCAPAYYRYCGWDTKIIPQQLNGEPCTNCGRVVQDNDIGTITKDCIVPVHAVQVYIHQIGQWVLIEVPEYAG